MIDEIKKKYKDEWVLIKVLKVDEFGVPVEGEVVAHSKSRDEVYEKQKFCVSKAFDGWGDVFVYYRII